MTIYLVAHLILGPVILLIALLFRNYPPKRVNNWYGYRTPRSMRSQEAWDSANAFSSRAMLIAAAATCFFQLFAYFLIGGKAGLLWSAGFLAVSLVIVIPITERYLKKKGFS
jgi:uncharacterized membrane protein